MPQTDSAFNENSTVTLAEAAKMLGVAYYTAWRWTKEGRFDGVTKTVAGRVHIPRAAVLAVLKSGCRTRGRRGQHG